MSDGSSERKQQHDVIGELRKRIQAPPRLARPFCLLQRTIDGYNRHQVGQTAAAIAYYGLFSLFPLILFVVGALGYIMGASSRQETIIAAITGYLPGSESLVRSTVQQVIKARGPVSLVAVVGLLWSASSVFSALVEAINRAWDVKVRRPFWQEKLVSLLLALASGLLILIAIISSTLAQIIGRYGDTLLPPDLAAVVSPLDVTGFVIAFITNVVAFTVMYKWIPVRPIAWKAALLGAILAGIGWELTKSVFAWYLTTFAVHNFNLVYGPLAAVIALLLWVYVTAIIILVGAEFSAAYAGCGEPKEDINDGLR